MTLQHGHSDTLGRVARLFSKRSLGVDLSEHEVRAVEVGPGGGGLAVLRAVTVPLTGQAGSESNRIVIAAAGLPRADAGLRVTVTLPAGLMGLRTLSLPDASPEEFPRLLAFQAARFSPLPAEELLCAGYVSPASTTPPHSALAAWARRAPVEAHCEPFGRGVHAQPRFVALYCFAFQYASPPPAVDLALADVGRASTGVVVFRDQEISFCRELNVGRTSLETASPAALEQFAAQLRGCFQRLHFTSSPGMLRPDRLYLTGEGSSLPGLDATLSRLLGLPVERLCPAIPGMAAGESARYAAALGAALAPMATHRVSLDLLPSSPSDAQSPPWKTHAVPSAVLALALTVSFGANAFWTDRTQTAAEAAGAEFGKRFPGRSAEPAALEKLLRELKTIGGHFSASRLLSGLESVLRGTKAGWAAEMVLENVRLDSAGKIAASGLAPSHEAVAGFVESLDASGLFEGSSLLADEAVGDGPKVRFRISTTATGRLRP